MPRLIKSTRYGQFSRPGLLNPEFTEKQMFLTRYLFALRDVWSVIICFMNKSSPSILVTPLFLVINEKNTEKLVSSVKSRSVFQQSAAWNIHNITSMTDGSPIIDNNSPRWRWIVLDIHFRTGQSACTKCKIPLCGILINYSINFKTMGP